MPEDGTKRWDDSLISLGLGALVVVVSGILIFNYFSQKSPDLVRQQGRPEITAYPSATPTGGAVAQNISTTAAPTTTPTQTSTAQPTNRPTATATVRPTATTQPTATARPTATATTRPSATSVSTLSPSPSPSASAQAVANTANNKDVLAAHTVVAGESLWSISERYYGSGYEWKKIAQANNITGAYSIEKGQALNIPRVEMTSSTNTDKPSQQVAQATTQPSASVSPQASASPAIGGANANSIITYTAVKGDTLWKIAADRCNDAYAWSSIARQNKLVNPGVIHSGNVLNFTCDR